MYSSHLLAFGRIVSSTIRGALKSVLVNLAFLHDDDDKAQRIHDQPMFTGVPGFYSRPKPPVKAQDATPAKPQGHCEVVGIRCADEVIPVAYRDLRLSARANPKEGEIGFAQYQGGFITMKDNADGNGTDITIYAVRRKPDGTPDKASVLAFDTTTGNSNVTITHETAATITITKEGKIVLLSPDGQAYVEVKNGGVVVNGANVAITGGAMLGDADPAAGDFVALAAKVLTELGNIKTAFDAHTHLYNPGPGVPAASAVPTAAMGTPGSVAATKVKAK
jgi:hypothetical protein